LEDLEFLDELKQKKVDEAQEAEESAKAAATKKTNTNGTDSSNTTPSTDKTKTSAKKQQKTPPNERITDVIFKISPRALTHSILTHATPTETFVNIVFECYRGNRLDTIRLRFVGYCLDFAGNSPLEDSSAHLIRCLFLVQNWAHWTSLSRLKVKGGYCVWCM
jgi:hypothetical protein